MSARFSLNQRNTGGHRPPLNVVQSRGGANRRVKVLSDPPQSTEVTHDRNGDSSGDDRVHSGDQDVNAVGPDGTTALHWAVRANDLQKVDTLLRTKANVKAADRYGITPLNLAAVNGNAAIIKKLLDAGADPNAVDLTGETVLMTAARTGMPDAIKLLIDRGAKINAVDPEFSETALMLAIRENLPAAVRVLIERGAALDAPTRVGPTPTFRLPCKGTGCGSEGVGINRGGIPIVARARRSMAA